jgi:hypothetical protein
MRAEFGGCRGKNACQSKSWGLLLCNFLPGYRKRVQLMADFRKHFWLIRVFFPTRPLRGVLLAGSFRHNVISRNALMMSGMMPGLRNGAQCRPGPAPSRG